MDYDRDKVKDWAGDSQLRAFRADLARFRASGYSGWGSEGFWALAIFRLQKSVGTMRPVWLRVLLALPLRLLRKFFVLLTGVDIHPSCSIGPGCLIPHGAQIRIIANTRIGADCSIGHLTTIGAGTVLEPATIGDHAHIACHVCILGPVRIGSGATIAASTLVIADVPGSHTAIGVPARILPLVKERHYGYRNTSADQSVESARDRE